MALGLLAIALLAADPAVLSPEVEKYLSAATNLYERLEFERALEQLQHARPHAASTHDDAQIALLEGVLYSELSQPEPARAAFVTALSLEPDAGLTFKVSPKVVSALERARAEVKKEAAPSRSIAAVEGLSTAAPEPKRSRAPIVVGAAAAACLIAGAVLIGLANGGAAQMSAGDP